jgi:hypothetical protein
VLIPAAIPNPGIMAIDLADAIPRKPWDDAESLK